MTNHWLRGAIVGIVVCAGCGGGGGGGGNSGGGGFGGGAGQAGFGGGGSGGLGGAGGQGGQAGQGGQGGMAGTGGQGGGAGQVIASIMVSPSQATIMVGATQQFSATARDGTGNVVSGVTFIWNSNNQGAATVDTTGLATGVGAGSATITASSGGINGVANLSVNQVTHSLTVTPAGAGSGMITSAPPGINCGGTCSANFASGTQVVLTATANLGSTFTGWSGGCSGTGTCSLTIDADKTVTATFVPNETLSVTVAGNGSVASSPPGLTCSAGTCSASFAAGTQVTLTATPDANSAFMGWSGACTGAGTCTITLAANQQVTATFGHTLSVTVAGGGSVTSSPGGINCSSGTCSAVFANSSSVMLTPTASNGYRFAGWSGACTGTGSCSPSMFMDQAVTATFVATADLSVTIVGQGSVTSNPTGINCSSGTCTATYVSGTPVTLTAVAAGGYQFTGWSGGGCGGTGTCVVPMTGATGVTATFTQTFTLTVGIGGQGNVQSTPPGINCGGGGASCSAAFTIGTQVTLAETPANGWAFSTWSGACGGSGACVVTMNADQSVGATFNGPFDFTVAPAAWTQLAGGSPLSFVPGETRTIPIVVTLTAGAPSQVTLSVTGLPAGMTASWNPQAVTPTGTASLSLTTAAGAALVGSTQLTLSGTDGNITRISHINVEIRSPHGLTAPWGLAIEAGGATALVTEDVPLGRLVRIDTTTFDVIKTVASPFTSIRDVAIESGGTTALVAHNGGLSRVDLATGVPTVLASLSSPWGVAIEAGGASALVTDCGAGGANNCSTAGRLARVNLGTGSVTALTSAGAGLNGLRSIAIESGGTTALVPEHGTDRLLRITLASGSVAPVSLNLLGPTGISIEAGGATALVTHDSGSGGVWAGLWRVRLATGSAAQISDGFVYGAAVAVEASGTNALVIDRDFPSPQLLRQFLGYPVASLGPGTQSFTSLYTGYGVAVEASGTVLVSDCGPGGCSSANGTLVRIDPATGLATPIVAAGLINPKGIAIESGGATALVIEPITGRLLRVTLASGAFTVVATGLNNAHDVKIESGGATALVTTMGGLARVVLATGATTTVADLAQAPCGFADYTQGLAIEAGGATALVVRNCPNQLARVNLATGVATTLSSGYQAPVGVAIESGGATALVVDVGMNGRLLRVDLATGAQTLLAGDLSGTNAGAPEFVAIDASGNALVPAGSGLFRISAAPARTPRTVAQALDYPVAMALESGGTTALAVDCGAANFLSPPNCTTTARLVRINLVSGAVTPIATGLNQPGGVAVESGGTTALVTECGPSNQSCTTSGRLLRVTLASGAIAQVATGLDTPTGIGIESGGTTALVALRGANQIVRIDLGGGGMTVVASNLPAVREVVPEAGGTTALAATDRQSNGQGGLVRVDLANGTFRTVVPVASQAFVVEPGGATALVIGQADLGHHLMRANLASGGIDVLMSGMVDAGTSIVLDSTGSHVFYSENRRNTGAVWTLSTP